MARGSVEPHAGPWSMTLRGPRVAGLEVDMRALRWTSSLLAGLVLVLSCGCGGSSGSSAAKGTGTLQVHLVDGPISGYQEVNVHIQAVEILGSGGWITLSTPNRVVDLLGLTGGLSETLAAGATLPAGQYGQMRLLLGTGSNVKLADGTIQPLKVPSGLQTGIKLTVNFEVLPGTTKDVWIDFDAARSIQVVQAGASGQYLLRPTVRAFDKVATGSIHGFLIDATTTLPLAGVLVHAEVLNGAGEASLARTAVTDALGAYTLDLLPVNATYYVVSQPLTAAVSPVAYDAKASDGFALSATMPVFTFNAAFTANPATGAVSGALTPMATASQSDLVYLQQTFSTASGNRAFIVRSAMAAVGTASETYAFSTVPAGSYGVQGVRTTLNADGTTTSVASPLQAATVAAGTAVTVNLGL